MKGKIVGLFIILSFFALCFAPISLAEESCGHECYFENMSLFIIGRFNYNNLFPIYKRPGGLFFGSTTDLIINATGTKFEGYKIHVFNMTYRFGSIMKTHGNETVILKNATGVFFLGEFIKRQRIFPPLLIISCHAEKIWVKWD